MQIERFALNTMNFDTLPAEEPTPVWFVGQHETEQESLPPLLDRLYQTQDLGYDFITTRITTETFQSKVTVLTQDHLQELEERSGPISTPLPLIPPLAPSDTALGPEDGSGSLVAIISPWIDLGSHDAVIARLSRQVLNLEVAYAAFCGISNILIHGPLPGADVVQYARAVRESLALGPYLQLQVLLPTTGELEQQHGDGMHLSELARNVDLAQEEDESERSADGSWEVWNTIRTLCGYSQKLAIAMELPRQLPSLNLQLRWHSEPVRFLILPRTSFLRNTKGYPVLSKMHQQFLSRYSRLRYPPWMVLSDLGPIPTPDISIANGTSTEPTPAEAASKAKEKPKDPVPHLRYLRHLQQNQPPRPPIERFGQGYQDYLQSPLQPLSDNLESITYEVFEKDPVKYEWYERAIAAALKDLAALLDSARDIVVAVVGAGRGPLVTRALQASQDTGININLSAVEKNPNAFVLLQRRNATDPLWNGQVNVVKSDMRHWRGPTISAQPAKVDIVISELLGSFADNELSPECLDGVQHVLHSGHGISIPQSYSAHLTPIATPKLHSELLGRGGNEKWDIPYVVMLHQFDYLCTHTESSGAHSLDVKQAWTFDHPAPPSILEQSRLRAGGTTDAGAWVGGDGSNEHNARSCKVDFSCRDQGICHGIAGYFETVLYSGSSGPIELSTNPVTMDHKSKDMISWFPAFFPIKTPIFVPEGAEMVVTMWRQTDDRSVWYEWLLEVFEGHKSGKRRLAMSELHSSRKNGCLM